MTIQSIQKMMEPTVLEILTALFKGLYIGLALFGASLGGLPLTFDDIKDL
jgi:Na+/H+-translocating membrane pyrophosphatase